ncbi:Trichodiene synthase (TRI5) [Allokutzneria albata]|uniref:Trichodiene synthase (TRI5) n=2 Tax=Allokutzneria albata TaxID=211114 RepID=A0A1G9T116_ALLAB|nr:Trichodiene synthase (TRI5) [Allokutzneria albata]
MLAEVARAGYPQQIQRLTEGFSPGVDEGDVESEARALVAELQELGVECDQRLARYLCTFRRLVLPVEDDALGLDLSRTYLYPTIIDDACGRRHSEVFRTLGTGMMKGIVTPARHRAAADSSLTPNSAAVDYMFNRIAEHCDADFLSTHKAFFYQSFIGIMFESQYAADASDQIDTEYVRNRTGFCEYYFSSLALAYDCLDFTGNLAFWGAALGRMVDYLNDLNDLISCYKEFLEGDFPANTVFRRAAHRGTSFLDAYAWTFDRGMSAYRRILELANPEQRPHVERYLKGYIHWHLTCGRYRWEEFSRLATT